MELCSPTTEKKNTSPTLSKAVGRHSRAVRDSQGWINCHLRDILGPGGSFGGFMMGISIKKCFWKGDLNLQNRPRWTI